VSLVKLTSAELADLDPVVLGLAVGQLAEQRPDHVVLLAIRVAIEVADARRAELLERRLAMRDASHDVAAAADWGRIAREHVPYEELQRRRAQPGPLTRTAA
jgi:hypothetical protein